MKRCFALFLAFMFLSHPVSAYAEPQTLLDLQNYITQYFDLIPTFPVTLSGEIVDIYNVATNHWEMKIVVPDDAGYTPIGEDHPYFIAHFRLHVAEVPFCIGDTVEITGSINSLYSSAMVPFIMVEYVNGSDEF